jgi:predicted ATP-dependent endonuclease of OLD family
VIMDSYYISSLYVKGLWGYRDFTLSFNEHINIIIGPNASGKTTLINILNFTLTANVLALSQFEFKEIRVSLKAFVGPGISSIRVTQHPEFTQIEFGEIKAAMPFGAMHGVGELRDALVHSTTLRRRMQPELYILREQVIRQVPVVWLPVSRRLPIADEEEAERRLLHRKPLESVDECLSDLLAGLQKYRVSLDFHLSELRKEFQKHALETILYDKQHDKMPEVKSLKLNSQEDKQQLLQAFTDVGFLDPKIKKRIDEHFAAADEAMRMLLGRTTPPEFTNIFIFPLINRTKSMVEFAQELERKRTDLFASLRSYENVINSFVLNKEIKVDDQGKLSIMNKKRRHNKGVLEWRHLSSGEKQILILLTQALLSEREPVVYVADEPELSLHVTWQEKLMSSLVQLAGRCQFIVATHSPDIAGGFSRYIIDLSRV